MRHIELKFRIEITLPDDYELSDKNIEQLTDYALTEAERLSRDRANCKEALILQLKKAGYLNDERSETK